MRRFNPGTVAAPVFLILITACGTSTPTSTSAPRIVATTPPVTTQAATSVSTAGSTGAATLPAPAPGTESAVLAATPDSTAEATVNVSSGTSQLVVPSLGSVPNDHADGWDRATGKITFAADGNGQSQVTIKAIGLVPNGTYTIWWYDAAVKYLPATLINALPVDANGNASISFVSDPNNATRTLFVIYNSAGVTVGKSIDRLAPTDYIHLFGSALGTAVLPADFGTTTGAATLAAPPQGTGPDF